MSRQNRHSLESDKKYVGHMLMINNVKFPESSPRHGADNDVETLRQVCALINIKPDVHENVTKQKLLADEGIITQFINSIIRRGIPNMIFVVIMTHGGGQGMLEMSCGAMVHKSEILEKFYTNRCGKLKNTPKVFLLQACRGGVAVNDRVDQAGGSTSALSMACSTGVTTDQMLLQGIDSKMFGDSEVTILQPNMLEYLILHSTEEDLPATRNHVHGALFMQIFCVVLRHLHKCTDFKTIVTRTAYWLNEAVQIFQLRHSNGIYASLKSPCVSCDNLTRDLYFTKDPDALSERNRQELEDSMNRELEILLKKHGARENDDNRQQQDDNSH